MIKCLNHKTCASHDQEDVLCFFLHLDVNEHVPVPLLEDGEEVVDLPPHDYPQAQQQARHHGEHNGHQQVYEEGHECPAGASDYHDNDADHV